MHNTKPRTLGPTTFGRKVDWELMRFFWDQLFFFLSSVGVSFGFLAYYLIFD